MKYLLVLMLVLLGGCDMPSVKSTYIKTEVGLIPYARAYCEGGLVFNNEMINLYNAAGEPITCTGYISLTQEEAKLKGFERP